MSIDQYGRAHLTLVRLPPPPVEDSDHSAETARAEGLWSELIAARTGNSAKALADLEDAVFRYYLPIARNLAHEWVDGTAGLKAAERAAELGLAQAVQAWRHRDSREFHRFATSSIQLQLQLKACDRDQAR